jgi:hypothetical protein
VTEEKDIISLISSGESTSLEFKERLPDPPRKIACEMAALANGQGGKIVIGVQDNGEVVGIADPDAVIRDVANLARDAVKPAIRPRVYRENIGGLSIVIVIVHIPQQMLPRQVGGKHYLRVGTTVRQATSEEVAALYVNRPGIEDFLLMYDSAFGDFRPQNVQRSDVVHLPAASYPDEWQRLQDMRVRFYQENEGLFLIHKWKPSTIPGQVADISIMLAQHREGPLTRQEVENVEYQLGPMFFVERVIKTDASDNFRLDVSASAPMLCLAKVTFRTGRLPLYLTRYIDCG